MRAETARNSIRDALSSSAETAALVEAAEELGPFGAIRVPVCTLARFLQVLAIETAAEFL